MVSTLANWWSLCESTGQCVKTMSGFSAYNNFSNSAICGFPKTLSPSICPTKSVLHLVFYSFDRFLFTNSASSHVLPSMPSSPVVKYIKVTSCPSFARVAAVPPQPLSGSSGWPPTTTIFFLSAGFFCWLRL